MFQLNKWHVARAVVPINYAWHRSLNEDRPAKLFGPGRHIQRVQPVKVVGYVVRHLLGDGYNVKGPGNRIDNGRASDAEFRSDEPASDTREIGDGIDRKNPRSRIDEAHLPQGHGAGS